MFRLGRRLGEKGPGLILLIPAIDRMVRVDLRTVVADIPAQDIITRDNVPAKVNAVTYFRIIDAASSVVRSSNTSPQRPRSPKTTLRSVLGKADLDALLAERERLSEVLQQIIDGQTDPWGVKVTAVEIKNVEIPGAMQRAIARQAEAERERRAKVIHAETRGADPVQQEMRRAFLAELGLPAAARVLEVGCGTGCAHACARSACWGSRA